MVDGEVAVLASGDIGIRPIRRLQPDEPAEAGRDADRAAAVAAGGQREDAAGDGRRRAARRAARRAVELPRVARRAVEHGAGDVDAAELGGRRLAGEHGPAEVAEPLRPASRWPWRSRRRTARRRGCSGQPATWSSSLTPIGTPPNGSDTSAAAAAAVARSRSRWQNAFSGLASMAAKTASSSSTGERSPRRNASTSEQASPATVCPPCGDLPRAAGPSGRAGAGGLRNRARADHRDAARQDGRRTIAARWTPAPSSACEPTHNRFRWKLPVTPGICTGGDFMFGGAGLGAAIAAMEGTSGRPDDLGDGAVPLVRPAGEVVDVDVTLAVEGHQMTQARAVCHVADREILTVNAALGAPPARRRRASGRRMPTDVPRPRTARPGRTARPDRRHDQRPARPAPRQGPRPGASSTARHGDGQTLLWARIPEVLDGVDGAALAVLGDFVPMGVGQALGRPRRRQQPRQHAAHRAARADRVGAARHPASTPSSAASATGWSTCSPRTARCWRRPARAASCGSGTSGAAGAHLPIQAVATA